MKIILITFHRVDRTIHNKNFTHKFVGLDLLVSRLKLRATITLDVTVPHMDLTETL